MRSSISEEKYTNVSLEENMAYEQWQIGVEENRKRRIDEIIFDVVRGFYGEIILPVVRQLRRLFSLE